MTLTLQRTDSRVVRWRICYDDGEGMATETLHLTRLGARFTLWLRPHDPTSPYALLPLWQRLARGRRDRRDWRHLRRTLDRQSERRKGDRRKGDRRRLRGD